MEIEKYIKAEMLREIRNSLLCPFCRCCLSDNLHLAFDSWCGMCGYGRTSLMVTDPHVAQIPSERALETLGLSSHSRH